MSGFTGQDHFAPDVYIIQEDDYVLGGEDGTANKSAKDLADRTKYLKNRQEEIKRALDRYGFSVGNDFSAGQIFFDAEFEDVNESFKAVALNNNGKFEKTTADPNKRIGISVISEDDELYAVIYGGHITLGPGFSKGSDVYVSTESPGELITETTTSTRIGFVVGENGKTILGSAFGSGESDSVLSIADNHYFETESERDNYFTANSGELYIGLYCVVDEEIYRWDQNWQKVTNVVRGPRGEAGPEGGITDELEDFGEELKDEIRDYRDQARHARDYAQVVSNFKGKWENLEGSLEHPAVVFHKNRYWVTLDSIDEIKNKEPGEDDIWEDLTLYDIWSYTPENTQFEYNKSGMVSKVTDEVKGITREFDIQYNNYGYIEEVKSTFMDITRIDTYKYDSEGRILEVGSNM